MIENSREAERFLKDLLTPQELNEFQGRWKVAQLLNSGEKSYREIAKETGMSVTTIGRVARFLKDEPYKGYAMILNKIKETSSEHHA